MRGLVATTCALFSVVCISVAHADRTFLVGGTVIEGKATRRGEQVVIEVGSGELTLPADAVERIETSESVVDRYEARYSKLRAGDVKARLLLADYCRDHDMRGRELQLLREILDIDGNNEQARLRLGYVKSDAGWITEAEAMRAKGMVQHDGQWMTPEQQLQLERTRVQTETAASARDIAQAELEAKKAELAAAKARLDAERTAISGAQAQPVSTPAATPVVIPSYAPGWPAANVSDFDGCGHARRCERRGFTDRYPFPIPGVRSPYDPTFLPPSVRDPHDSL